MTEAPMTVLGIEMESLMDNQAPGAQASAVDLPILPETPSVEDLFQKYNLTHQRYFNLLLGAYLALSGRGSLQLVTSLPLEQTSTMVRELTRCIVDGLLPYLKGKVSFSSGNDPRMTISVICTAQTPNPSSDLMFGVEDDGYTEIPIPDELTRLTFATLTGLSHQDRRTSLIKMQSWLEQIVDLKKAPSLPLICTAYCISSGIELNTQVLLMLFRCIGNDQNIAFDVMDKLLVDLIRRLGDGLQIPADGLYMLADYFLSPNSSDLYRSICETTLATAPVEVCINLAEAVISLPMTDRVRQILKALLRRIPTDDPGISDELRTSLILWVLAENSKEFIDYATVLLLACPASEQEHLALGILQSTCDTDLSTLTPPPEEAAEEDTEISEEEAAAREEANATYLLQLQALTVDRPMTEAQDAILAKSLGYMAANQLDMADAYVSILDKHIPAYSAALRQNALEFLFRIRLAKLDAEQGLQLAVRLNRFDTTFGDCIVQGLKDGKNPGVWELFNTRTRKWDEMTRLNVEATLRDANNFNNPCGPFETAAMERWIQLIVSDFSDEEEIKFATYNNLAKHWLTCTDELNLSLDAQATISHKIAELFWRHVDMDMIYQNTHGLCDKRLCRDETIDPIKMTVAGVCIELRNDIKNCRCLIDQLENPENTPQIRTALVECARKLLFNFLNRYKYLSWDLALCSCWKFSEKDSGPDMKQFLECCEKLDAIAEDQNIDLLIDVESSVLLADEQMRKTVCKLNSNSAIFQKLTDVIKPERAGFFSFLKGKKEKADPNANAKNGDRQKGKNK